VATKFPGIAHDFYAGPGREIDVIKLYGSIELAPILGLSDVIVDHRGDGQRHSRKTSLSYVETICPVSARLIANKVGFKFKHEGIGALPKRRRSYQRGSMR
jgi:ATP phosphoribosyltransferase